MEFTSIVVAFDGVWSVTNVYSNFKTVCIDIIHGSTLSQIIDSVSEAIGHDETWKIASLALYKDDTEKKMMLPLTEERDVEWMHNGFRNGLYLDWCILAKRSSIRTDMDITEGGPVTVVVGRMLPTKDDLKEALCKLALRMNFQFKTVKSSPKQFTAICVHETCNWYVRASVYRGGHLWVIRKFIDSHTCPVGVVQNGHMQATPIIVQGFAESLISSAKNRSITPGDVMEHAKKNHGVNISYYKAMKGKERALQRINGRPEDSYAFLAKFATNLIEKNPGSYTAHDVDDDDRFRYFFMSMAASINGWEHCLPAITVDGASLKNKFAGTLITACSFDGNGRIFPLAFAVVDSENDASWGWFFRNLKAVFGEHEDLTIVSDRHQSIENGIKSVYPTAHQGICVFHLMKNIKPGHRTQAFIRTYFSCVNAYTPEDFEYYMRQLEQMVPNVRNRMEEAGVQRWARAYAPKNRYLLMTTNISESLNKRLVHARELPIISLLEEIRDFMQQWFYARRNQATFERLDISRHCDGVLRDHSRVSRTMDVRHINNSRFDVRHEYKQFVVDIGLRTCTCKQWQLDLIPCPHACAAIDRKGLDIHSFVDEFFKTTNLKSMYGADINPIGTSHHAVPTEGEEFVHPPNVRRGAGRPRKRRIRAHHEAGTRLRCGRCGRAGHNKRTCRDPPI